jgi:hypothetical protein
MSLTITPVADSLDYWGHYAVQLFDIALDNSYPTNGYAVTAANFGIGPILVGMQFVGGNKAAGELLYWYDTANKKIVAYFPTGGGSAATSLTAPTASGGAGTITGAPGLGTLAVSGAPTAGTLSATTPAGGTAVTSSSAQPAMTIAGAPGLGTLAVSGAPTAGTLAVASGAAGTLVGGIGIEVGSTTDLHTLTVRALVLTLG